MLLYLDACKRKQNLFATENKIFRVSHSFFLSWNDSFELILSNLQMSKSFLLIDLMVCVQ